MEKTGIGWIGVGAMGSAMCENLLRAGHRVTVYDRQRGRADELRQAGAAVAGSARELAAGADLVFSTIFDDAGLRDIVLGMEGVVAGGRAGLLYVDMSTVSPAASAEVASALAEQGIRYLRAPVSGTVSLAREARLSAFVSGPREAFEQVRPVLQSLTAKQLYVGPAEEARIVKLLINLMVFMSTAVIGEAMDFGARLGLDRGLMLEAINGSIVASPHYAVKAAKLQQREYSPAGAIDLVVKDMDLALAVAREGALPMPISALVRQYLAVLQSRGMGSLDVAVLADALALMSGAVHDADLLTAAAAGAAH